jgi:hypothetical protein
MSMFAGTARLQNMFNAHNGPIIIRPLVGFGLGQPACDESVCGQQSTHWPFKVAAFAQSPDQCGHL